VRFIVTYRLRPDPDRDPDYRIVGCCPLSDKTCTDVTGEHHSELVEAASFDEATSLARAFGQRVVRVEEA
jgi:hypothetical protein